jgi:glycosyltransferase involved in cell wall biosynthesis
LPLINQPMVRISCSVKLYAFQVAEQLGRHSMMDKFYTVYHSAKNPLLSKFNHRRDLEKIDIRKIKTFPYVAALIKLGSKPFTTNGLFDAHVASDLKRNSDYSIFLGWSGMSIRSMTQAKKDGKKIVLERASSHIRFQFQLLEEEYQKWGLIFKGDPRVAAQEEREYELADYVTVPSGFVERSFINLGFPKEKLFKNNFGANQYFSPSKPKRNKFTIVYVGSLSIRKGLPYFFEALKQITIDPASFDVWFIGKISPEIQKIIPNYQQPNWQFFGHVNHYELSDLISQCSVAVQPSLEEGLSMVIPQLMACATPVIATTNTGGEDIITDGSTGYIIPIRSATAIAEKLSLLYSDKTLLHALQQNAASYANQFGNWDQYGDRYATFLKQLAH